MFNVPLFFTDTILRDYKNSTAVTLILGGKKASKRTQNSYILCTYTGTRSFLHCTLTPTLQNYTHHNLSYKKGRGRGIAYSLSSELEGVYQL
jgi:hypothetical protein